MATVITTIDGTDVIANSRTDINNNFSSLNTNKIETSVIDTDTSLTANSDSKIPSQKAVKAYIDNSTGIIPATTTTKGVSKISVAPVDNANPIVVGDNDPRLSTSFGGTGADGALSITSGTTTIDLGAVAYFEKNYTSISITGTGKLAFTNKHLNGTIIVLKSQGNITLTSSTAPMIDCSGLGGSGGAGKVDTGNGTIGTKGVGFLLYDTNPGAGGLSSGTAAGGAIPSTVSIIPSKVNSLTSLKYFNIFCGAGGGGGAAGNLGAGRSSGVGGAGGGGLIIECGGGWNFTTTGGISVAGGVGANSDAGLSGNYHGCGGAGGGGGSAVILYKTLISNTGTFILTGGAKGTDTINAAGNTASTGGGGGGITAGTGGVTTTTTQSTGGVGGDGISIVAKYY
jgi:hypothetical protein